MQIKVVRGPAALVVILIVLALITFMLPMVLLLTGIAIVGSLISGVMKLFSAPQKPQIQNTTGTIIDIPAEIQ